jgi:hypothetical protein
LCDAHHILERDRPPTRPTVADDILFERLLPQGPAVRIRRTSEPGILPMTAVLEVERRTRRAVPGGQPPCLLAVTADSEAEIMAYLEPKARTDTVVATLMREVGLESAPEATG